MKNCELFRTSDLHDWYERRVIEPTLASLEEFQERDSGWALSRILDLTININKYNPMRAGCHIKLPQEIMKKKAVINVQFNDNACFAWSVVAALYPVERNSERESSYPHYTAVLNLQDIEFPVTVNQIKKFERANDISINVYCLEEKNIVPIRLSELKRDKHINLFYVQDPRDDNVGHFAWIKNLSRLVSSQLSKKEHRKYICDRCLHYFESNNKLQSHTIDYQQMNECAIRLPSEKDKWLEFNNYNRKELLPFVVYTDLECMLKKTNNDPIMSTYTFQHHEVFSVAYYIHCAYDETLSAYYSRRNVDCITWFVEELKNLAHRVKNIISANVPMVTLSHEQCETFRSATHCHICEKPFAPDDTRVRDHCHLTERYRGPAHSNCFTWDAMLKHTKIKFELLTDIDMAMFIERGIRSGLSQCSGRYAHANNKYMRSYDPSKSSSYLMYFDVNNLYGWAMCQPLPYADFRWVDDISDFNISAIASDSPIGYILEVDLEYPQHLHNAHADLPFCPIRDKPPGKREDKLLATLYDKKRYVIHYRNLQQCTRHGLRVTKIHRVLQFTQSAWLRDYIELNTKFRTLARNDFEKNLYKLMNNAVFGKTMENVRNHVDVKLLTKWDGRYGAEAMIAKPNFHSRIIFSENLVAVELRKLEYLHEEIEMTRQQSCIRSKLHEVYTIRETKIALSPYDDKRYIVPDSTNLLP
ncbi:uncharacterized protein LOC126852138 [Cataglyphis hispanica]|uniref:uncharacterized protein LOC126852138 n=1 Tax=Cataglyphis hispanica TaxID=1086592 RepID=UPI00217F68C7|nr:uncharacterized protein LOC126852138 [Cataglyphis hispanica]